MLRLQRFAAHQITNDSSVNMVALLGGLFQTGLQLESRRYLPARGTKPLPRYLWDMKHLEELTGGKYTHEPLRVHRLGGRHPETRRKVNQHIGGGVKFDYFSEFLSF